MGRPMGSTWRSAYIVPKRGFACLSQAPIDSLSAIEEGFFEAGVGWPNTSRLKREANLTLTWYCWLQPGSIRVQQ